MKPRLLITRRMPDLVLRDAMQDFDVMLRENITPMGRAAAVSALLDYDAILTTLGDDFGAETFAQVPAPRTKVLANFGVGYDHISVAGAARSGVIVSNTPGVVTEATADLALTLMLMVARRAGEGERLVRSGGWTGWQPTQMLGMHLSGKRLGILGMGRIGQAIAKRAHHGFGMQIAYVNRSDPKGLEVPATRRASAAELAAGCDVLVIAVPGGTETRHMVSAEVIAQMPRHAILINIARGDVVEEAALIAALQGGWIAGAGLDVYEQEPEVPQALRDLDNVILLPHLGTAALEVREAMGLMGLSNIRAVMAGQAAPNALN